MIRRSVDIRLLPIALAVWSSTYAFLNGRYVLGWASTAGTILFTAYSGLGWPGRAWLLRWSECAATMSVIACLSAACFWSATTRAAAWEEESARISAHGMTLQGFHARLVSEVKESIPQDEGYKTKKKQRARYFARAQYVKGRQPMTFLLSSETSQFAHLRRGDVIALDGKLDLTWSHSIPNVGSIRVKKWELLPSTDRWSQFSRAFRGNLERVVSSLPQHARALVPGMSLGDDHQASAQMRNDMKTVSFAHLTAVSGAHMSILLMTIGLLSPRKKQWKLVVQLAVLLLFVALVGPQASVLRSFGVSLIAFGGMWLNREGGIYSSLSAVVIAVCLLSPFDACSLGFCLSVLATWGVSVPTRWISHEGEKIGVATENAWIPRMSALLAIPLGAQLATLPVMISMNSWIGLWSIPAQILISPFVTPVTIASFAAALGAQLYAPLGFVCAWIASWGTAWISAVARFFSSLPGARVSLGNNAGIFAVGAGISIALIAAARLRRFTTSRPLERVTLGGES